MVELASGQFKERGDDRSSDLRQVSGDDADLLKPNRRSAEGGGEPFVVGRALRIVPRLGWADRRSCRIEDSKAVLP